MRKSVNSNNSNSNSNSNSSSSSAVKEALAPHNKDVKDVKESKESEVRLIDMQQPVLDFKGKPIKVTETLDGVLLDFLQAAIGQTQSKTPEEMILKARMANRINNNSNGGVSFKSEEITILKKCFMQAFNDVTSIQILNIIAPEEFE
jgi:hypothetical protein